MKNSTETNRAHPLSSSFETIYGTLTVEDPLALELIYSEPMQRLKHINQYGTFEYAVKSQRSYTRYTHSLGVYYLLKQVGCSRLEQIAGLLHDVSHTAFSHSTDVLFLGDQVSGAYQDRIHEQFLQQRGIARILNKYGYSAHDMNILQQYFPALKQSHPDLCADRIDYILSAGIKEGFMSVADVRETVKNLRYKNNTWYLKDLNMAKKIGDISLHETLNRWGGSISLAVNFLSKELFQKSIENNLITLEDILYEKNDQEIWRIFRCSSNPHIQALVMQISHTQWTKKVFPQQCDKKYFSKFRGVDPLVKIKGRKISRTSHMDKEFKENFSQTEKKIKTGFCL